MMLVVIIDETTAIGFCVPFFNFPHSMKRRERGDDFFTFCFPGADHVMIPEGTISLKLHPLHV